MSAMPILACTAPPPATLPATKPAETKPGRKTPVSPAKPEAEDHTGGEKAAAASLTLAAVMAETGGKMPPSTALTVAEAARRLNVTRQMRQSGRLRSFRPGTGRALRIPPGAVEQHENESGAREPAPRLPDIVNRYC
jgi:excisionase family DNA binding protein